MFMVHCAKQGPCEMGNHHAHERDGPVNAVTAPVTIAAIEIIINLVLLMLRPVLAA